MTLHGTLIDTAANEMTNSFKTQWFKSLLRQDMTYFDIMDISGTATIIGVNGMKYKMGMGNKLGEGIQFFFTLTGGLTFAIWSSWRVTLVMIVTVLPVMALSIFSLLKMNQTQSARADESYGKAGSIVHTSVTSIRTILSMNGVEEMIQRFTAATQEAFEGASSQAIYVGAANGAVMGSLMLCYLPLVLYGGYLVYEGIRETGCDPSGAVLSNEECTPSASGVFGAMLGVTFGSAALPQVLGAMQEMVAVRAAVYPAIQVMNRKFKEDEDDSGDDKTSTRSTLPDYQIDSSSDRGLKLCDPQGKIDFQDVTFAYPTRQEKNILNSFSLSIPAGKTIALVGSSGHGKSTVASLIQRFYDPIAGSISMDGTDLKDMNVQWLREQIGVVSQEPRLFAGTIHENIKIAFPEAGQQDIEEAAKRANAHDFIMSFPDGYDTHVGQDGAQLSGGQKQRIAIARALIRRPRILLLDEATSALDSESEAVVQEAIDKIMEEQMQTVILVAHRLSTIRNADSIVVIHEGAAVEQGTHDELMQNRSYFFELSEEKELDAFSSASMTDECLSFTDEEEPCDEKIQKNECLLLLQDVNFHYPSRPSSKIFMGLDLQINQGETLAIVGPSGQGKSTIIQLLEGFYRPTSGTISYKGTNVEEINVDWLRKQFGLVSQEPNLFHASIGENIRFGNPAATQEDIEEAAKAANAHDFIVSFPDKYDTIVGATGSTKVSGGEKQRIAIARALLRKPKVLLLDEATSALDSTSERVVQVALDKIMADQTQTTIVIAHRLSTIRNADRIAVVDQGRVCELGSHDELVMIEEGTYRKLQSLQNMDSDERNTLVTTKRYNSSKEPKADSIGAKEMEKANDTEGVVQEKGNGSVIQKARQFSKGNYGLFFIGSIGAVLAGLMFPGWGFTFAYMIELLYRPVPVCDADFRTCQEEWDRVADEMQALSFNIACGLAGVICSAVVGNSLVWYGFGTAAERLNKKARDAVFKNLLRQEVAWFDTQSVDALASRVADDTALLNTFCGSPVRMAIMNISSVFVGIATSFFFMWPFAVVAVFTLPFLVFAARARVKMFLGEDEGTYKHESEKSSGGIVIETLSNIRTVASLGIENACSKKYLETLQIEVPSSISINMRKASMGLGQLVRVWCIALFFWWGGFILHNQPGEYTLRDFFISMFSLLFSITGMAMSMQGVSDPKVAKEAAKRVFELIERTSAIDPLSTNGRKDL
ncbi:MAG: hypothetical protein SGBAC_006615 [Bacillariaceae sp.]